MIISGVGSFLNICIGQGTPRNVCAYAGHFVATFTLTHTVTFPPNPFLLFFFSFENHFSWWSTTRFGIDFTEISTYICLPYLSLPIFFYCFSEIPSFCGFLFFVNRKFEIKYYYTVALSSGAKKNKCCNRPFISFPLSPLPPILHSLLVWHSCVTFHCWIVATNTHTIFFSFPLPMSSLSVATIFIRTSCLLIHLITGHAADVKY